MSDPVEKRRRGRDRDAGKGGQVWREHDKRICERRGPEEALEIQSRAWIGMSGGMVIS